jgi:hypothetical protein
MSTKLAVLLLTVSLPVVSLAWGPDGHMAVGLIAQHYLTTSARQRAIQLLQGDHLGDHRVANWADFIRGNKGYDQTYPGNHQWHYVDIDVKTAATNFSLPADGNDVADQILFWQRALVNKTNSVERRRDALRFLVHFVADVHQPLHCAMRDDDRGGNLLPIHSFHGMRYTIDPDMAREHALNLHKTWDEYLVNESMDDPSAVNFTWKLLKGISEEQAAAWRSGDPKTWAWESHELAVSNAYCYSDGSPLPEASDGKLIDLTEQNYIAANVPIVCQQLQKAGVRLAMLVNEALGVR